MKRNSKFLNLKVETNKNIEKAGKGIKSPLSILAAKSPIKTIQSPLGGGKTSGMKNYSFCRSPGLKAAVERRSKMSRAQGPKSDSSDDNNKKQDAGFYFFDIDYSNRIINVDLEIKNKNKEDRNFLNYQKRAKRAKMAKFEMVNRRQHYGNKWYITPKKWNESMIKTNDKYKQEIMSNEKGIKLETNMTFERMIDTLKSKHEESESKEFKATLSKHLKMKEGHTDIIEEFEKDINKIVE